MTTREEQITFLYTHDLEKAEAFYSGTLRLQEVFAKGGCRFYRVSESSYLGVCQRADREVSPAGVTVSIVTPDVDLWYRRVIQDGVETDGPPRHSEAFGIYNFFAFDPEGYRIEFQRFTDPAWPGAAGVEEDED